MEIQKRTEKKLREITKKDSFPFRGRRMEHFSKQRITIWCGSERAVKYHVGKQTQAKTEIYTESNTEAIKEYKEKRMGCSRKNIPRFLVC